MFSYFTVTTKRKPELNELILNTANSNLQDQSHPYLHIPMDPKYLYFESAKPVNNKYIGGLLSADNKGEYSGCGLEELMSQRREIILSKAQMLLSEICQRYRLREENLYKISLDQCTCRNLIYLQGDNFLDKTRIDLERQIIGLEQEKRKEKGSYFRDILFLRKELRETVIEKLEEDQKAAMFTNQAEELT